MKLVNTTQSYSEVCCLKNVQKRSFFWSVFSRIRTEYGDLLFVFTRIRENTCQKKLRIWTLFTQWLCNKSIDVYEKTQWLFCMFFESCLCRLSLNVYILLKNNCSRFSCTISTRFHLWNSTTEVSACPVLRNNTFLMFLWVFLDWEEI